MAASRPQARTMSPMWRVSSKVPGRWVEYDNGTVTGDTESYRQMLANAGKPVAYAPMAATYTPTSREDQVGLYLLACAIIGGGHDVTGEPPAVPEPQPEPVVGQVVY